MSAVIVAGALVKAALFGGENIQQLLHAARQNMPHHRFLVLMGINMSQMVLAFAFDFHLLQRLNAASFSGVAADAGMAGMLFDFVYLSTLNFSFSATATCCRRRCRRASRIWSRSCWRS